MEHIPTEKIFAAVASTFSLNKEELCGPGRNARFANARKAFCYLIKKHGKRMNREAIGKLICRAGSSVAHAIIASNRHIDSNDYQFCKLLKMAEAHLGLNEEICPHCGQPTIQKK